METTTLKLYSLEYKEAKTYLMAALFIAGNIVFPQLCHTVNMGGPTWLPIYLFTLVGAYKYGWRVGLLTAVASPFINSAWFGMPVPASLPAILLKIHSACRNCRLYRTSLSESIHCFDAGSGSGISADRHIGRMASER